MDKIRNARLTRVIATAVHENVGASEPSVAVQWQYSLTATTVGSAYIKYSQIRLLLRSKLVLSGVDGRDESRSNYG